MADAACTAFAGKTPPRTWSRALLLTLLPIPCAYGCGAVIVAASDLVAAHVVDGDPSAGWQASCRSCNERAKRRGWGRPSDGVPGGSTRARQSGVRPGFSLFGAPRDRTTRCSAAPATRRRVRETATGGPHTRVLRSRNPRLPIVYTRPSFAKNIRGRRGPGSPTGATRRRSGAVSRRMATSTTE